MTPEGLFLFYPSNPYYKCVCVYMYIQYIYIYVCTYLLLYVCTHTYISIYIYTHIQSVSYIYMCIYIYRYIVHVYYIYPIYGWVYPNQPQSFSTRSPRSEDTPSRGQPVCRTWAPGKKKRRKVDFIGQEPTSS